MVLADLVRLRAGGAHGQYTRVADDGKQAAAAAAPAGAPGGDDDEDWLVPTPRGPNAGVDDSPFVWPAQADDDDAQPFGSGRRFILPGEFQ